MIRLAALVLLLAACGSPTPSGGTGTIVITAVYEVPGGNQPVSIGGYGVFATIPGHVEEEQEVPFEDELRFDLPAGTHHLALVTRAASDMISCVEGGECEREFFDISAVCEDDVDVPAGGTVFVTYRAIGGERCEVAVDAGA